MRAFFLAVIAGALFAAVGPVAPATADFNSLLLGCTATPNQDAADDNTGNGNQLPITVCTDGVPSHGGYNVNPGSEHAVAVPARYTGPGQPDQAPDAAAEPGAWADGSVSLDVDLTLPDPGLNPMPAGGYPVIAMMHGCCSGDKTGWEARTINDGGEKWHYSNAWFAARGYVVVNYTSRGFVNGSGNGSTGETQLDSNRYEINDFQNLVGQLANSTDLNPNSSANPIVNPQKVIATGGSYGGGFSWMALTDPTWKSPAPARKDMRLVAVAPKFGWTNLVESLVPNGLDPRDSLPGTDPSRAASPLGYPKRSIVAGLYASGRTGVPPGSAHATFNGGDIDNAFQCLNSADPFESNPVCAHTLDTTLPRFINERSAYFQNGFFAGLANGSIAPIPVFSAGTLTDPLFPPAEHRRMVDRLKATVPGYPVEEYYGDYNHFVQDKEKEWGDLCGSDHHLCRYSDYAGGNLNADPPSLAREHGVTTRLNRFLDFYAKPPGDPAPPQPPFDVTAALQVCPPNAGAEKVPADEPGERFTAPTFGALTQGSLTISATGAQSTTFNAGSNPHAKNADPVANQVKNNKQCALEDSSGGFATAGPGVATYDSVDLPREVILLGRTRLTITHTGTGDPRVLAARLYDLYPNGTQVLIDRGVRRLTQANGATVLDLHGNGWRLQKGHRVRIEIAQDDEPYIKASNVPGTLMISAAKLELPIRGASFSLRGFAPPTGPRANLRVPRLASDQGTGRRIRLRLSAAKKADRRFIHHYQLEVRRNRAKRFRRLSSRIRKSAYRLKTRLGSTYTLRARAVDGKGHAGPWDTEITITPLDDGRRMGVRAAAGWRRARSRKAFGHRLSRSARRRVGFRYRFRGDRVYLVGRTSRRGGRAVVVLDRKRKVVSFRSRRTRNRRVVWKARTSRRRRVHRLRVAVVGGGLVEIDGLAFRRR